MAAVLQRCCILNALLLGLSLCLPATSQQTHSTPTPAFAREMMDSMAKMDKDMMSAPMTGDPDHDFAAMMIPHHLGAVDMAKVELLHGKDPVLRRLAQEIIVTQHQEIEVMQRRLTAFKASAPRLHRAIAPALHEASRSHLESTPRKAAQKESARTEEAQPAPASIALSGRDRVYTAEQTSNTVSVIDPATNTLLGVIRLGDPVPGALSPLYRGQLLVHGLGFSPDHRTLAVVSIGSNSVTLIDTATNKVQGVVYIGRSPHETFFTPDGKELWVTVRGEDYVSVIDPVKRQEIRRVQTANGPGMVLFRPDGRYAFVPSSFTPELDVVDTKTYKVIARVPQASPFSPNLAVSRDGQEVWFTLKDSGKTQVMSAKPPFRILETLDTGPISNHVALVENANGKFAYVTVGGENVVKVYHRGVRPKLIATIATGDLPHGIWQSGDGTRVYVGLENQDAVAAIDAIHNKVIATIPIGQQPQALVYVPNAVPTGEGRSNLMPLGEAGQVAHLNMSVPEGTTGSGRATVSVNALGPLDLLQMAVSGLKPGQRYRLWLVTSRSAPFGQKQPLVTFKTNVAGAQIAQAIGPFRQVLTSKSGDAAETLQQQFLLLTLADSDAPQLLQNAPRPEAD